MASTDLDRPAKHAVLYLRVSTKDQASRNGEAEGYSIPAQRLACRQKADALGTTVVEEFVDAGESARSAHRPELQRMLAYVEVNRVDLLIVHKIDRLARNRMDDLQITLALEKAGVQLVSCSEQIDNKTPAGKLTHGLMALIAEWYSSNLSAEVKTKTLQKVRNGDSVGRAPTGYLNTRKRIDGREIRTIDIDSDRAEHVRWAFRAYASGDYTVRQLTAALEARGLTVVPTKSVPEASLSVSKVHRMLRNRFYIGYFTWDGVEYEGNHERLIDPKVFQTVQALLDARNLAGEKQRLHNHYLKGTVHCGGCGSRLCITHATNRWGTTYVYFFCLGRQQRRTNCVRKAVPVELVEDRIEQLWQHVHLSSDYSQLLDALLREELDSYLAEAAQTRAAATRRLQVLQGQRRKLLDAHYAGAIPLDLLKSEQDRLTSETEACERQMETATAASDSIQTALDRCLEFLHDAATRYHTAPATSRRRMNQALFERIVIEEDGTVVGHLTGPYRQLLSPDLVVAATTKLTSKEPDSPAAEPAEPQLISFDPSAWHHGVPAWLARHRSWQQHTKRPLAATAAKGQTQGPNRAFSCAWGLKKNHLVGPVGLEPTTYGLKVRSSAIELEARCATTRQGYAGRLLHIVLQGLLDHSGDHRVDSMKSIKAPRSCAQKTVSPSSCADFRLPSLNTPLITAAGTMPRSPKRLSQMVAF